MNMFSFLLSLVTLAVWEYYSTSQYKHMLTLPAYNSLLGDFNMGIDDSALWG